MKDIHEFFVQDFDAVREGEPMMLWLDIDRR